MIRALAHFLQDERGQDLVEYSLLLALIAIAVLAFLGGMNKNLRGILTSTNSAVVSANTAAS